MHLVHPALFTRMLAELQLCQSPSQLAGFHCWRASWTACCIVPLVCLDPPQGAHCLYSLANRLTLFYREEPIFFWPFSACQPHLCSPCGHPGQAGCAVNYDCTMTHSTSALLLMVLFFCCLSLVLEFLLSTLPQPVEETVLNQLKVLLAWLIRGNLAKLTKNEIIWNYPSCTTYTLCGHGHFP